MLKPDELFTYNTTISNILAISFNLKMGNTSFV